MLDTSARLLRLLSLLSERPTWTGAELVEALEITSRTLRRDVDRLRQLGYPIDSTSGPAGGYALAAGREVPPLSFEPDEVLAVALGLGLASFEGGNRNVRAAAASAVEKVARVLPTRLQKRLARLQAAVHGTGRDDPQGRVAELASACAERRVSSFEYARADGVESEREVEPHGITWVSGRWYLVAYDRGRRDWRTFRVERIRSPVRRAGEFVPRELPATDLAAWVEGAQATPRWPLEGRIVYALPAEEVRARVPTRFGRVETIDALRSRLVVTGSSWEAMAAWVAVVGPPERIEGPEGLRDAVGALAKRLRAASRG